MFAKCKSFETRYRRRLKPSICRESLENDLSDTSFVHDRVVSEVVTVKIV